MIIDDTQNTNLIVDNIFSWAKIFDDFIKYLTCQLDVCLSQNLSLSLKKSFFCTGRMEFVGHDVCANGNHPAMSKHALMEHWPAFVTARDIASFIGFPFFSSMYIPRFEQCIAFLWLLTKNDMSTDITHLLTTEHEAEKVDMINAIYNDPCIARFDYNKRSYLLSDFSKNSSGYDICQRDSDHPESMASMRQEMGRGDCKFLLARSTLCLRSTGFGSRTTCGCESTFHSHLGEAFSPWTGQFIKIKPSFGVCALQP